jgi:hypothetical protein
MQKLKSAVTDGCFLIFAIMDERKNNGRRWAPMELLQ